MLNTTSFEWVHGVLQHWDIPAILLIEGLKGTSVFKVVTPESKYVLKDGNQWPSERYEFVGDVLDFLSKSSFPYRVPTFIKGKNGYVATEDARGRFTLCRFIESSGSPNPLGSDGKILFESGKAIGHLHNALASYDDSRLGERTWRQNAFADLQSQIEDFSILTEPQRIAVKMLADQQGELWSSALLDLPEQLIHRDCYPENILVDHFSIVGFIDFDNLCIASPVYDMAYYVTDLHWLTPLPEAGQVWLSHLPKFVNGYQEVRLLSQNELRAFPYFMMSMQLLFVYWYMGQQKHEIANAHLKALLWLHRNLAKIAQAVSGT
jgi:Ser/Thr protein kinase RdoA (MazF antagonist)